MHFCLCLEYQTKVFRNETAVLFSDKLLLLDRDINMLILYPAIALAIANQ